MQYRADIDGLRAVAVLPVLFFHAGYSFLPGGFLGVDVFFVISGYLITGLLLNDLQRDRFSIVNFYERRARRILPALTLVVVATWILCFIFLPASQFKEFSQSLVAVVFFVSNIFFFRESGYFAQAAEEMPLLHTWSLAVEEQFYLFFPILLWIGWRLFRPYLMHIFFGVSVLSVLGSELLVSKGYHEAAFYLIPSRTWELLAGSMLAVYVARGPGFAPSNMRSLASLVVLMLSFVFFTGDIPHPGIATIIPVAATAGIIAYTGPATLAYRLLTLGPIIFIGLISYSLYLWHQPLLAVIRAKTIGHPDLSVTSAALAASVVLAYLSFRFVETPSRNRSSMSQKQVFSLSAAVSLALVAIGLTGHVKDGIPNRFDVPSYADSMTSSPMREKCHTHGERYLEPAEACVYGDTSNVTWAVFGDSHIVEPAFALSEILEQNNEGLLHLSFSGCMPAYGLDVGPPGCRRWYDESVNYLVDSDTIENVFVGFRYSYHLFGDIIHTYPELPNLPPYYEQNSRNIFDDWALAREAGWKQLKITVDRLNAAGKRVVVLYPIPELPAHIEKITAPKWIFSRESLINPNKVTSAELYAARHVYILGKLGGMDFNFKLNAIRPTDSLCQDDSCAAILDDRAMYFDDDHLSIDGARRVIEQQLKGPSER